MQQSAHLVAKCAFVRHLEIYRPLPGPCRVLYQAGLLGVPAVRRRLLKKPSQPRTIAPQGAAKVADAAVNFWPVLVQAYALDPVGILLGVGACIAAAALSVLLIAAVPALLALRRTAHAAEALLHSLREELPDTAAALRLSSLEMSDAIEEVSSLGADLTEGLRSSARVITGAEQGLRDSMSLAGEAMTSYIIPGVKQRIPRTKEVLENALKERADLTYREPSLQEMAGATKVVTKRLRTAVGALGALRRVSYGVDRMRGTRMDFMDHQENGA